MHLIWYVCNRSAHDRSIVRSLRSKPATNSVHDVTAAFQYPGYKLALGSLSPYQVYTEPIQSDAG